jgi:hypothetical protein
LIFGSLSRIDYQEAQKRTFGTHPSVRYFFNATEEDDVERSCHEELTWEDVLAIASFCHRGKNWNPQSLMRYQRNHYARSQWLEQKKNPLGWMCAQKRPIHGLTKVLHHYRQQHEKLPDYLIIMDDDSYYQLEFVQDELRRYRPETAQVLAGCLFHNRIKEKKSKVEHNFTFPFGGYGTILSRGAIANLMRPVYCQNRQRDEFEETACQRLDENQLEEKYLFREGMSIGELMEAYAASQPYKGHANWTHGFCLHSDWALSFFLNFYYISNDFRNSSQLDIPHNQMAGYMGSDYFVVYTRRAKRRKVQYGQCNNDSPAKCTNSSHICHYQTPESMELLRAQWS